MPASNTASPPGATRLVIAGPAGAGKSTLAATLAQLLGWEVIESDDFHTEQAQAILEIGGELSRAYRAQRFGRIVNAVRNADGDVAIPFSALTKSFRKSLRTRIPGVLIVYLHLTRDDARRRLSQRVEPEGSRRGPKAQESVLNQQHEMLELPDGELDTLVIDAMLPEEQVTRLVVDWLRDIGRLPNAGRLCG